jgi:putative transposase
MPKLKHYNHDNSVRFITFSCYGRKPYLNLPHTKEILAKQIKLSREINSFKLLGYVFMPEHVHLVIYPLPDTKVGQMIGSIKSHTAIKYSHANKFDSTRTPLVFWLKRCYDYNCRSISEVKEKINYCHDNPVTRGLVENAGDWIWSSHNWYCGKHDVPISIDVYEL